MLIDLLIVVKSANLNFNVTVRADSLWVFKKSESDCVISDKLSSNLSASDTSEIKVSSALNDFLFRSVLMDE